MSTKERIYKFIPKNLIKIWHSMRSTAYPIVHLPYKAFEIVYKVKDETWEDSYYPECYEHSKEQHLVVYRQPEFIYKEYVGIVCSESDAIITSKGVYWDKFNSEEFVTWAEPSDQNVLWYSKNDIGIRKYKKVEHIEGRVFTLLGVWANHWGHCMYQFLPKLYTAGEAGLLDNNITLLIVEDEDSTIMELINSYLINFPKVQIKFAKPKVEYICQELFFMPSSGSNFNGCKFRLDYPYYISRHVLDKLKRYVVEPIIEKVKDREVKYDKIFLPRGNFRTLNNYKEVHDYFSSLGYVDIEGSSLTLEEKASIFYHAKEVVGLYGSAFLNLMFCNQPKCMVFTNYKMSTDTSLYIQIRDYVSCLINVAGQDDSEDYHSNYYIPLDKIKKVYNERIGR